MTKLSTGADATLGEYKKLATAVFGSESPAVAFLGKKIQESPKGENEEVMTAEGQMVHALMTIHSQNK
jgi:hypothetical protein